VVVAMPDGNVEIYAYPEAVFPHLKLCAPVTFKETLLVFGRAHYALEPLNTLTWGEPVPYKPPPTNDE
jgi:hypothetical protein